MFAFPLPKDPTTSRLMDNCPPGAHSDSSPSMTDATGCTTSGGLWDFVIVSWGWDCYVINEKA
jgi:hypothetical protein